jgi:hypothetical protein
MTNHIPKEDETLVQHFGRKKKAFKIISWNDIYKKQNRK